MNDCEGCIYLIKGERKDRQGYTMKTSACLCEREMAASCIPTYSFDDYHIYKGKMVKKGNFIIFRKQRNKALKDNVTFQLSGTEKEKNKK